jgi:hypothetical protein
MRNESQHASAFFLLRLLGTLPGRGRGCVKAANWCHQTRRTDIAQKVKNLPKGVLKERNEELNSCRRCDWREPWTRHCAHLIQCAVCE